MRCFLFESAGAPPPGVANTIGPGIGSTGPDSLRDFKPEDLIGVFLSKVDIVAFQHLRNFRALVVGCYVGVWEKKPGAEHGEAPLRHTVQIVNVLQRCETSGAQQHSLYHQEDVLRVSLKKTMFSFTAS